jgi:hypothetical protein
VKVEAEKEGQSENKTKTTAILKVERESNEDILDFHDYYPAGGFECLGLSFLQTKKDIISTQLNSGISLPNFTSFSVLPSSFSWS